MIIHKGRGPPTTNLGSCMTQRVGRQPPGFLASLTASYKACLSSKNNQWWGGTWVTSAPEGKSPDIALWGMPFS